MNIMRSRAKTFTVEIKRANKRSAASASVRPTTFDTASDTMLKRIFGNSAALPSRSGEQHARSDDVSDGTRPPQVSSGVDVGVARISRTPEPNARRVLPDLLSVVVDPVEERMKQQAEQRAARRRALLESRRSNGFERLPSGACSPRSGRLIGRRRSGGTAADHIGEAEELRADGCDEEGAACWAASPSAPSRSTMEAAPAPGLLVMDKSPAESGALHTHELT